MEKDSSPELLTLDAIEEHNVPCVACGHWNRLVTLPSNNICKCGSCGSAFNVEEKSKFSIPYYSSGFSGFNWGSSGFSGFSGFSGNTNDFSNGGQVFFSSGSGFSGQTVAERRAERKEKRIARREARKKRKGILGFLDSLTQ
jgi:hypothetical protein